MASDGGSCVVVEGGSFFFIYILCSSHKKTFLLSDVRASWVSRTGEVAEPEVQEDRNPERINVSVGCVGRTCALKGLKRTSFKSWVYS